MGMPADKDIYIKLPLNGGQCFQISPGNDLVSVDEANLEVADLDDLCFGQRRHVNVEVALDCMHLRLG